jgi:hypothetical protein
MSRHNNYSSSNQTTGVDTRIDLLATEATLKQIQTAVSGISGETGFEVSDTETHTKLDTLNTTVADKHLNYETDSITVSEMPALNFTKDSVNVVEEVHSITYDLELYGAALYADSVNYNVGIDPNGRDGWFFQNSATTGGTNNYWYSNSTVPQNNMTKGEVECIYNIMSLDRVQPNIVLPIVAVFSKPTGSGDISPVAHSRWLYTIPANSILNAGEVIMLTIGDESKVANIRPELRRVNLPLFSETGECLDSEIIAYISLNTDSGVKPLGGIQYLLQNAGFYYSITEKVVDYQFVNSVDRKIKDGFISEGVYTRATGYNGTSWEPIGIDPGTTKVLVSDSATTALNLKIYNATETDTEAIKVYTVNGGGGSGGLVQIQGYNGTDWENITATMGTLQVSDYKIHNATETDTEAIKVYTVNGGGSSGGQVQIQGLTTGTDYEDIHATLNGTTYSLDSNITNASLDVHCFGSSNGTVFHHLKTDANGQLQTEARAHDGAGNNIGSTVVNTVRGLNVNVVGNSNLGSRGNIYTGTLTTAQITTAVAINNEYGNNSVITYQDASTTSTAFINIQASVDGTNFVVIGTLQPANVLSSARTAFANLKLKAFTHIRIQSSATVSLTSVVCSLFSS